LCECPGKNFAAGAAAQHDEIVFFHGFLPSYEFSAASAHLTIPRVEDGRGRRILQSSSLAHRHFMPNFAVLNEAPKLLSRAA